VPRFSVIIPAYNVAEYIADALRSVFAQSFRDFEVIVINDASPDTPALEAALGPFLARLKYLQQPWGGVSAARNAGISAAGGEYLAFLDGDDVWLPGGLAAQEEFLRADPSLDLAWADLEVSGPRIPAGRTAMRVNPAERPVTLERLILGRCVPTTSSVVARRSAVIEAGQFDREFQHSEDFDLWVRMAVRGARLDFHRAVVGRRRVRADAASADRCAMNAGLLAVLDKLGARTDLPAEARPAIEHVRRRTAAHLQLEKGRRCLRQKQYAEAMAALRCANAFFASPKLDLLLRGLKVAPGPTRAAAEAWRRLYPLLARLRSARMP
jgi:glycosyltransferase involved in cell wall biosynthesis